MRAYANLTSGISAAAYGPPDGYVRFQSTLLEQKQWGKFIREVDYNFLADLAKGEMVVVTDRVTPDHMKWGSRAQWQGLPLIEYVVRQVWFDDRPMVTWRACNVTDFVGAIFNHLRRADLEKILYFKRLDPSPDFQILSCWEATKMDGQYNYWADRFHGRDAMEAVP